MKKLLLFLAAAFSFVLVSNKAFAVRPNLAYTNITVTFGTAFTITPTNSGGAPVTCTAAPALAAGISIANTTGIITGTNTVAIGTYTYTITPTNATGVQTVKPTVTITVVAAATLSYTSPGAFAVNTAITPVSPTSSGVAANGYGTGTNLTGATLNAPYGMTIDGSGNIYATNYGGATVSKWNSAGVYQSTYGTGNPAYSRPTGIVFDGSGNGYVLNRGAGANNGKVYKFNNTGTYTSQIISGLSQPDGLAIDASGNLYITDANNNRIYKYSNTGTLLLTISTNLNGPENVAVDASGNIYALNNTNGTLAKFTSAGAFVSNIVVGLSATNAWGLSIDALGDIFIGDSGNGRVREYTLTGTTITTITALTDPEGMVADSKGNLYVSDFTNSTVTKYPPIGGYFITSITGGSTSLPAGLSFNTTTGVLSGTPTTTFASTTINVTAYNSAGTAVNASFVISCVSLPTTLTYASPNVFSVGYAATLTPAYSNGVSTSASYVSVPAGTLLSTYGLTFNTTTGVITGTPTGVLAATNFVVTANNASGTPTTSNTFSIACVAPPVFAYPQSTYIFTTNLSVGALVQPSVTSGGPVSIYSISPALPGTLTFNTGTGQITGTPTATLAATTYTITGTNTTSGGVGTTTITISVVAPPVFAYATKVYTVGVPITTLSATGTGIPLTSATISGLPGGLGIAANGDITGTPTTVTAAANYTVTAVGSNGGTGTATVRITVVAAPVFSYTNPPAYTAGTAITNLSPNITSDGPLSGATISPGLPAGLTMSAAGVISGTPTAAAATTTYTVTATGADGGIGTATVVITVNLPPAPAFTYTSPNNYLVASAASLSPTPGGGTVAALAYGTGTALTATGLNEPDGMAFDAAGNLYVTNYNAGTVVKYTAGGGTATSFITGLTNPTGIVFDAAGNVYVSQFNGYVYRYTSTGTTKTQIVQGGTGTGTRPASAYGLAIDASGNLYIADGSGQNLYKWTASTATTAILVATGTGQLRTPVDVAVDASGFIYTLDNSRNKVQKYTSAGAVSNANLITGLTNAFGFSMDNGGNIYIGDSGTGTVSVYSSAGTFLTSITNSDPEGVTTDAAGDMFVSNFTTNTVTKYIPTGGYVLNYVSGTTSLPPGLSFNGTTGVISGTPTTLFSGTYTVTGYNIGGGYTCPSFIINCVTKPIFTYPTPDSYAVSATNITPLSPTITGSPITGYTVSPALPAGLTMDPVTGIITGPPNAAAATATYTVTGTNAYGTGTFPIVITITAPPAFTYASPDNLTQGTAMAALAPASTGGTVPPAGTYAASTILTSANVSSPEGMAVDASGNLFVADAGNNKITEYSTTGTVTTFTVANTPVGIAFDASGNAYVLEQGNNSVVKYTGGMSGTATTGFITGLNTPGGIAVDASGNIYITNTGNEQIKKFPPTGGATATWTVNDFTLLGSLVTGGIAVDASGNVYVAVNNINIFAGAYDGIDVFSSTGTYNVSYTGFNNLYGISIDASGNIYLADAGNGKTYVYTAGLGSQIVTETGFTTPEGIVADANGNFYVSDFANNTVTKFSITGGYKITSGSLPRGILFNTNTGTFTGTPQDVFTSTTLTVTGYNVGGSGSATVVFNCAANPPIISYTPAVNVYPVGVAIAALAPAVSGGPEIAAGFTTPGTTLTGATVSGPWGMTTDPSGNIWVVNNTTGTFSEWNSAGTFVKTVNPTTATANPTGIAVDAAGNIYICVGNGNLYKFNATGTTRTTLTTTPGGGYGIVMDASGNIYETDRTDGFVYKYTASTATTSILISSTSGGGITQPTGIKLDPSGNIYVVDQTTKSILEYNPSGVFEGAVASGQSIPYGLYVDSHADYFVGDPGSSNSVKEYNDAGTLVASITGLGSPRGLTMDASGDIYVSDFTNNTVKKYPPFYYVLSGGTVPPGLTFDTKTGTFTGTPTAAFPTTTFTVSVFGAFGNNSTTVTITCAYPPNFTYASPQTYTDGTAIPTLNPTFAIPNGGGPLVSATVTTNGPLPPGLVLNADGSITGTPTTVNGPVTYTITGTNAAGLTGTATVTITCNPALPIISYVTPQVYHVGVPITPLVPTNTGGAVASWGISPALPPGLSFDTTTGIISGTPTAVSPAINYIVTATNVTGSATCVVNISVLTDAPVITYTTPDVYNVGSTITPLVPSNSGGAVATWSISPGLPAGLTFDVTTGIITGTPTTPSPAANYTVTATNAGGTGTFVINITCNAGGPVLTYTTPDVFPVGVAITPLNPANTGTAPTGYSISPGLPAGLNFDTTTGIISGTPTATSPVTVYTVTATDASSNTGSFNISIACVNGNDWLGGTSTDWTDATNWSAGTVPTATDVANIGANVPFTNFPNLLAGAGTINVGSIIIGTNGGQAGGVVVNAGSTLNISGTITYQSDSNSGLAYTASLSGAGTITAAGINVTANTTLGVPAAYTETLATSVSSLSLSSNVALTSTVDGSSNALSAAFNITGGTVSVAGTIQTSNGATSTSTLSVNTATLQLSGAAALSGLSGTGTNIISFKNAGATIAYSGAGQTWYTDAAITGLPGGESYTNIKFSGTGVKSPNGTNANNLLVSGDFTNAITLNDATDYIDLGTPKVNFNGTTQNIYAGNGTGTKFYNVTFSGTGTTTIQSGSASVASTGILTMSGAGATLAAGGFLTLNSDINGTASVAAIPAGCSITGNVNAQRFITGGGLNYRGYRLLSSPVYGSTNGTSNIYSVNYLINSVYLKGQAGVPGGWDAGGNPNVYLFRENLASSNAGFSVGNFRSLNTLGTAPNYGYLIDNDPGTFNIPAGDGFMFFFRGDRNAASLAAETTVSYIPTNTILTATGTLNQGPVTVSDWYTPASTSLGWTTTAGNTSVQGYNLVGNPYASSIDWDQYMFSAPGSAIYAPNVNPFIYIIDPVNGNYNVYKAGMAGVGTIVTTNSNIIPSGQGFFVQAANASAQLVFNESAKVATQANAAGGNLLMGHPPMAATAQVSQYLHLKMLKDTTGVDGIIISFNGNTSSNYNPAEDARYRNGNGSVSITSMSADNVPLAINSMPLPAQTKQTIIPLNVNASTDGTAQIQMAEVKSIPALFTIWLKDAYKKDSLDIRANPTYTFDILHSDTNSYGSHRFTLVMGENPALMIHLLSFGASKIPTGDQVVWTTENEQNYTNFTVERSTDGGTTFNALGGFASSAQSTYSYLDKVPVNGPNMYRLKIVDLNGTISYSNVVTIMYANTGQIAINGLMVYPNPTANMINLSITSNQTTGTSTTPAGAKASYNIEIVNNQGSVIKSTQSSSPLWQSDVTALTPGTYFIRVINTSNNTVVGKSAFVKL